MKSKYALIQKEWDRADSLALAIESLSKEELLQRLLAFPSSLLPDDFNEDYTQWDNDETLELRWWLFDLEFDA